MRLQSRVWRRVFALGHLARFLIADRPVPLFASLEVTRRCRRSCRYCASPRDDKEMPLSVWKAILDDLAGAGALAVSVTGGEPLERSDVVEICEHAVRLGLVVSLNTNGLLLPERLEVLSFVDRLNLSLDAIGEANDLVRGSGAFEGAQAAIALAQGASVPVTLTAVISRHSLAGLVDLLSWVASHDVPVMFQPAYETLLRSDGLVNPERPELPAMRGALATIVAAKEVGVPIRNSRAALRHMLGGHPPCQCQGGRLFIRVTSSGDLEICGLSGDPSPKGISVFGGVVEGMRRICAIPNSCRRCESSVRAEFNLLASLNRDAWQERVFDTLLKGLW